ncbi:MAG: hypothetical protein ACLSA0_28170 [Eisenbergiella massiliensis]
MKKEKGKAGTLIRLGGYLLHYKWYLAAALVLTVGSNLFALIGPMLSGYAVDAIEPGPGKVNFGRVFLFCGLDGGILCGFFNFFPICCRC